MKEIEKKVYDYIMDKSNEGIPPSIREICAELDIKSTSTAARYVENLVAAGLLEKVGGRNRAIKPAAANFVRVPVIGSLNDTDNITSAENITGYVTISLENKCTGKLFAIYMSDESMVNAGILKGDTVIAEQSDDIASGGLAVVLTNGEYKVRKIYKENGECRLQPENSDIDSVLTGECRVLGRVTAVIRYL